MSKELNLELAEKGLILAKKCFKNFTNVELEMAREIIALEENIKALKGGEVTEEKIIPPEVKEEATTVNVTSEEKPIYAKKIVSNKDSELSPNENFDKKAKVKAKEETPKQVETTKKITDEPLW